MNQKEETEEHWFTEWIGIAGGRIIGTPVLVAGLRNGVERTQGSRNTEGEKRG